MPNQALMQTYSALSASSFVQIGLLDADAWAKRSDGLRQQRHAIIRSNGLYERHAGERYVLLAGERAARAMALGCVAERLSVGIPAQHLAPNWFGSLASHGAMEMIVGRGARDALRQPSIVGAVGSLAPMYNMQSQFAEYGLVGLVTERLPLALSRTCERHSWTRLGDCLLAVAVAARYFLLQIRTGIAIYVAAQVTVAGALYTALEMTVLCVVSAVAAAVRRIPGLSELAPVRRLVAQLDALVARIASPAEGPRPRSAEEHRKFNDAVNRKTTVLLQRLCLLVDENDEKRSQKLNEMAEHITHDLRCFCRAEPDNRSLLYGLSLIKSTIEMTFDEEDGLVYEPRELAKRP